MNRAGALLAVVCIVTAMPAALDAADPDAGPGWSLGLEAYLYLLDDGHFLLPIVSADRGSLHLEGRYQYEDLRTASAWVGWSFATGTMLELEVVPMAGVVAGRTDGLAPGLELTLGWQSLELYSENEYVFDLGSSEGDFFYSWNELGWQAEPWLRLGLTAQLTREAGGDLEIDRGLFVGVSRGAAELMVYGYELGGDGAFTIVAVAWGF